MTSPTIVGMPLLAACLFLNGCSSTPTGNSESRIPEGFFGTMYVNGSAVSTTFGGYVCNPDWNSGGSDDYFYFVGTSSLIDIGLAFYEYELREGGDFSDVANKGFVSVSFAGQGLNQGSYEFSGRVEDWSGGRAKITFSYRSIMNGAVYEFREGKLNLLVGARGTGCS